MVKFSRKKLFTFIRESTVYIIFIIRSTEE